MQANKIHETKVFKNGNSQAIRIPKDFQLNAESVFISKNEKGELIISTHASKLNEFYSFLNMNQHKFEGFMNEREDLSPEEKELFSNNTG